MCIIIDGITVPITENNSVLSPVFKAEAMGETDWNNMSLASFEKEWENPEDAVYDNWREVYGILAE